MHIRFIGSGLVLCTLLTACGGSADDFESEAIAESSQGLRHRIPIPPQLVGPCTPAEPRFWYDKPDLTFTDDAVEIRIDGHIFRNVPWGGAVYLPFWNGSYQPHHVRFRAKIVNDSCKSYTSEHWQGTGPYEFFSVHYYIDNHDQYVGHSFTAPFYGRALRESFTTFIDYTGTRLYDLYGTGPHKLIFRVDDGNSISEQNENNNERYIWLWVDRPFQFVAGRN